MCIQNNLQASRAEGQQRPHGAATQTRTASALSVDSSQADLSQFELGTASSEVDSGGSDTDTASVTSAQGLRHGGGAGVGGVECSMPTKRVKSAAATGGALRGMKQQQQQQLSSQQSNNSTAAVQPSQQQQQQQQHKMMLHELQHGGATQSLRGKQAKRSSKHPRKASATSSLSRVTHRMRRLLIRRARWWWWCMKELTVCLVNSIFLDSSSSSSSSKAGSSRQEASHPRNLQSAGSAVTPQTGSGLISPQGMLHGAYSVGGGLHQLNLAQNPGGAGGILGTSVPPAGLHISTMPSQPLTRSGSPDSISDTPPTNSTPREMTTQQIAGSSATTGPPQLPHAPSLSPVASLSNFAYAHAGLNAGFGVMHEGLMLQGTGGYYPLHSIPMRKVQSTGCLADPVHYGLGVTECQGSTNDAAGKGIGVRGPSPSRPLFKWLLRSIVLYEGYGWLKVRLATMRNHRFHWRTDVSFM